MKPPLLLCWAAGVCFFTVAPSTLKEPECGAPLVFNHVPQFALPEVLTRLPAAGCWCRRSAELLSCAWLLPGLLVARVLCLAPRSKLHAGADSAYVVKLAIHRGSVNLILVTVCLQKMMPSFELGSAVECWGVLRPPAAVFEACLV